MAFGRSNSLSINTGATNSLFSQQNATSQPPAPAGGLFGGSSTTTSQPTQTGGLFGGGAATSQPQQQGGLFGRLGTSQPQQAGGLFGGATTAQPQQSGGLFGGGAPSQPQQSGGLFGGAAPSQPQQGGGLFGGNTGTQQQGGLFGGASNTQQSTGGSSLFGPKLNQPQQSGGTGLFGASTANNRPSGGLFGASTTNNAQATGSSSLFGGGSSLFGGNNQQNQPQSNSLFGGSIQQQQQQQPSNTFLGMTATAPGSNTSMLSASQYRNPQLSSFSGRLTLGQSGSNTTTLAGGTSTQAGQGGTGAVQINYDTMKSTTRFGDLVPDAQQALERIDAMIQAQEKFARQIEAFIPKHGGDVESLATDVDFVREKTEAVETALALDARGVEGEQKVLQKDEQNGRRLGGVVDNLRMPPQYHLRGDDARGKDLDLIGHFFTPLTGEMEKNLGVYANALAEVEAHIGILEQSVMSAGGRAGGAGSGVGSVRELAETLGAFEEGILAAAGMVGQCREGVNGLVLGSGGFGAR